MRLLVAIALLFAAAAHAGPDRAALVGTWHHEGDLPNGTHVATTMSFQEAGTFSGFIDSNGKRIWNFAGKWVLSGKWLHYHYTVSDLPRVGPGTKDRDEVVAITGTELHLNNSNGQITYVRIK